MENKNKPETFEIEEVLPKDSESSNRELDMSETFEINDEGAIGEKKEKTLEEKEENVEKKVEEDDESLKEFHLIISDIEAFFNKYKETGKEEKKRQGIWSRLMGGKAKETEEIKSRQKEAQEIYKRLEEIEGGIFEEQRKELIEIFKKEAEEIAEERAEKVDEVIEGLNEQTSKEIEKVNKEKPGLFERISARFEKNGLEIVITLGLLAMLAAMPRENALELITSGRIKSFMPIEYANLGLIVSTAAVLKIANSDFLTRNIRKYFGDKTLKEEQGDSPVLVDSGDKEEILEKNDEVDPSQEGVKEENDEKKQDKRKEWSEKDEMFERYDGRGQKNQEEEKQEEWSEKDEMFERYDGRGQKNQEEEKQEEWSEKDEMFGRFDGINTTELKEEEKLVRGDPKEIQKLFKVERILKADGFVFAEGDSVFGFTRHDSEIIDGEWKFMGHVGDVVLISKGEGRDGVVQKIKIDKFLEINSESKVDEIESIDNEVNEEEKMLNFIKQGVSKGEKRELKYKGEFGWYATDVKEEKGKRPMISIKKKQGNDARIIHVDLSKIEKAKK
ncbi:MAG: hypothetical protein PHF54_02090 [Candidatus Pacebacteria bacterium]|nr:hypothetical protein [Candidatus Paceibacterota bacterium]